MKQEIERRKRKPEIKNVGFWSNSNEPWAKGKRISLALWIWKDWNSWVARKEGIHIVAFRVEAIWCGKLFKKNGTRRSGH